MKTRRATDNNATQIADNNVQASSTSILPLCGANSEKMEDASILRLRPALHAAVLTRDLIAERAQAIWLKRGCPRNRDEENWRQAETQLNTEMGIV